MCPAYQWSTFFGQKGCSWAGQGVCVRAPARVHRGRMRQSERAKNCALCCAVKDAESAARESLRIISCLSAPTSVEVAACQLRLATVLAGGAPRCAAAGGSTPGQYTPG